MTHREDVYTVKQIYTGMYMCQSQDHTPQCNMTLLCVGVTTEGTDMVMKVNWRQPYRLDHSPQLSVDRSSLLCTYMTRGGGSLHSHKDPFTSRTSWCYVTGLYCTVKGI